MQRARRIGFEEHLVARVQVLEPLSFRDEFEAPQNGKMDGSQIQRCTRATKVQFQPRGRLLVSQFHGDQLMPAAVLPVRTIRHLLLDVQHRIAVQEEGSTRQGGGWACGCPGVRG